MVIVTIGKYWFRPVSMNLFLCLTVVVFLIVIASPSSFAGPPELEIERFFGEKVSWALRGNQGIDTDPLLNNWVRRIGNEVAEVSPRQELPYRFVILGSDAANALTAPGANIFVTRGLLDAVDSDDELAAVLAHETGHVTQKHARAQIEETAAAYGILAGIQRVGYPKAAQLGFYVNVLRTLDRSRHMEEQADQYGLKATTEAGYDALGFIHFLDGFDLRRRSDLEDYFSTHPSPAYRLEKASESPYVRKDNPGEREAIAASFEARGMPISAAKVRAGKDPLTLPPVSPLPILPEYIQRDRESVLKREAELRGGLMSVYKLNQANYALRTILLVNGQADVFWLYFASRAFAVQTRCEDLYSRTLRLTRTAPGTFDALSGQFTLAPGPLAIEAALGRSESIQALARAQGSPTPLRRAATALTIVLADLNNRFYRPKGFVRYARFAVWEGLIRFAESELARVDKQTGQAWRLLATARIRRYQTALTLLVPQDDIQKRALWYELASRRFGIWFPVSGPTGEATVRAALALEINKSASELTATRGDTLWADYVLTQKGIPENIATALRMLTLDVERELSLP